MTEQEQKAFDLMREALKEIISAHPVSTSLRQTDAVIAAREALTASNAVSHPQATESAGYKLVPVDPTREMLVALVCTGLRNTFYEEGRARFMEEMAQGYGAMLAAAPEAKQ